MRVAALGFARVVRSTAMVAVRRSDAGSKRWMRARLAGSGRPNKRAPTWPCAQTPAESSCVMRRGVVSGAGRSCEYPGATRAQGRLFRGPAARPDKREQVLVATKWVKKGRALRRQLILRFVPDYPGRGLGQLLRLGCCQARPPRRLLRVQRQSSTNYQKVKKNTYRQCSFEGIGGGKQCTSN